MLFVNRTRRLYPEARHASTSPESRNMPQDVALRNLPEPQGSETVLVVNPHEEEVSFLRNALEPSKWNVVGRKSRREALCFLFDQPVSVLITESSLSDGVWKDVLGDVSNFQDPPKIIVTSDLGDERLWAEALSCGAYDVLAKPFHRSEIRRIISLAWNGWRQARERMTAIKPAVMVAGG
jgi:DNA-binding NtrC family response regulator